VFATTQPSSPARNLNSALAVVTLAILLPLLGTVPALATAEAPPNLETSVQDMTAEISRALGNYRYDDIFDWIEARVDGRTVTLSGAVHQPWKRDSVERRLERIDGVASVVNEIEVLPVSGFDDQIRIQVARSIYGSHAFFDRAHWTSPPIHILVNKGRITLEGVVNNEAERMLVRSLASRSPHSIGKIQNNLVLEREIAR
jgi:hyperosmotically inducible protein